MKARKSTFFIVVIAILALSYVAAFGLGPIKGANNMRMGMDINGGFEAVYQAKIKPGDSKPTPEELDAVKRVFELRMEAGNNDDYDIAVNNADYMIIVQSPWKSDEKDFDPTKAMEELGATGHLTFRDPSGEIIVEGKHVVSAKAEVNNNQTSFDTSKYYISLEFNDEGAALFADATGRLVNQSIAICMDYDPENQDTIISNPRVNGRIDGGKAVITGDFTQAETKRTAGIISAGALPFEMECIQSSTVSPTLGKNALNVMLLASLIAFILVCLFMLFYYRLTGFVACFALLLQIVCQILALSIPQYPLTLSGIAAIILSIGMGVDANIISAERIKEEINAGKTVGGAIDAGFHRAFSAVFDGNMTGALVAIVMMVMGSGTMKSFGFSLLTGMLFNFLAGVWSTRLMTKSLSAYESLRKPALYGARRAKND